MNANDTQHASEEDTEMHEAATANVSQAQAKPRINSGQLLSGSKEVIIDHQGMEYRLRLTRQGKLILTK